MSATLPSAQALLKQAQAVLAETELRAPFAGVVAALTMKVGEYVTPGTPAVHLADLSAWQIETTDLTELNVVRVREGNPALVTFDAIPGLELLGRSAASERLARTSRAISPMSSRLRPIVRRRNYAGT